MQPIQRLTIVYDSGCGLCAEVRAWVEKQRQQVPVDFVAAGPEAERLFGPLPAGELAVIADTGDAWLGNSAWLVCLWALTEYRDLAVRLSSPVLVLMAREAFSLVSSNRATLSSLAGSKSAQQLEQSLRKVVVMKCQN